jgi:predicted metal-dependent hydrolase
MRGLLQFTLDLFTLDLPAPQPSSPADRSPAERIDQVLTPVSYRHPQASRELMLAGVHVAYAFRRGKRRTIGFSVGAEGLAVSAPKWVPLYEVDRAVHEKGDWILRKLQETRERQGRIDATRVDWCDGAQLPYLGQTLTVELDPAHHFTGGGQRVGEPGAQRLLLGLPHSATAEQIRDAAQAWLMRQAKPLFEQRLHHFAPRLGVRWTQLTLSSAATRWGSAKSDGSIRLHWRLIHFRLEVIDYVVVHELSHLRVMDHSPHFWGTVGTVVPNYDALRSELRDLPIPSW